MSRLTGWRGMALVGAASALVCGAVAWKIQAWRYDAVLANQSAEHAAVLAQQALAVVESVQAARAIEQRRAEFMEQERDHAIKQNEALAADVAAGRDVSERLRRELSALRARYAGINTGAAERGQGEQGADTIGVLIDLYQRLDQTGREVAEYADRLRIAGLACERSHDGLRPTQ